MILPLSPGRSTRCWLSFRPWRTASCRPPRERVQQLFLSLPAAVFPQLSSCSFLCLSLGSPTGCLACLSFADEAIAAVALTAFHRLSPPFAAFRRLSLPFAAFHCLSLRLCWCRPAAPVLPPRGDTEMQPAPAFAPPPTTVRQPCVAPVCAAKALPLPCVATAYAAKTAPLPCGPQVVMAEAVAVDLQGDSASMM